MALDLGTEPDGGCGSSGGTFHYSTRETETGLVYRASSGTVKTSQRNPVSGGKILNDKYKYCYQSSFLYNICQVLMVCSMHMDEQLLEVVHCVAGG